MLLTVHEVAARCRVNKATVWAFRRSDPTFPQPIKLSQGCTRWHDHEVEAWIAARPRKALTDEAAEAA